MLLQSFITDLRATIVLQRFAGLVKVKGSSVMVRASLLFLNHFCLIFHLRSPRVRSSTRLILHATTLKSSTLTIPSQVHVFTLISSHYTIPTMAPRGKRRAGGSIHGNEKRRRLDTGSASQPITISNSQPSTAARTSPRRALATAASQATEEHLFESQLLLI